ncbi:MAG TPA: GWxTD domain-containing protein [Bacteroidales bacterium]|nr:GWxTD domain-containing protein [Bacteroidales bacterium]
MDKGLIYNGMFRFKKNFLVYAPVLLLLAAVLNSCSTSQQVLDSKDLSYLYNPTKNPIAPRYSITSISENSALFSIKFYPTDLFFSEANPRGVPMALMLVTVKLFNVSSGNVLADTAVMNLNIVKETGRNEYVYSTELNVEKDQKYMADVKLLDKLRMTVVQAFVPYNTTSEFNRYTYTARSHFEKNPLFNPVVRENEYVNLVYNLGLEDSLYISYYKPFTPVPDPPSMLLPEKTLDYDPDTTMVIPYSPGQPLMFPARGIYLCSVNSDAKDGFTFLNLGDEYPGITKPETMIEPLVYLATSDEMNIMRASVRPKADLDEFWIKLGGNVDKSRELIRIFYTRVQYSNYYFTSYKEGWRTERGMIYIIYGPPDKVYKSAEGESWGYRKPVIKSSWGGRFSVKDEYLFFNFRKKDDIFSDNDYFLSRSETLVTYWDQAIASWRRGIVYRLDNPEDL